MSQPLLSILIPTVYGREDSLNELYADIKKQVGGWSEAFMCEDVRISGLKNNEVEVVVFKDTKIIPIGEKREILYKKAKGLFSWQIDDDDSIATNAIELILNAIKENPDVDCVTFEENCMMNGKYYKSNHSLQYPSWYGDGSHLLHDGFHFHRTPFYKDVIKTSIAQSTPFHPIRFGEDHLWSIDIYDKLKTEHHINKELYFYIYEPKESHNERYGITQ